MAVLAVAGGGVFESERHGWIAQSLAAAGTPQQPTADYAQQAATDDKQDIAEAQGFITPLRPFFSILVALGVLVQVVLIHRALEDRGEPQRATRPPSASLSRPA